MWVNFGEKKRLCVARDPPPLINSFSHISPQRVSAHAASARETDGPTDAPSCVPRKIHFSGKLRAANRPTISSRKHARRWESSLDITMCFSSSGFSWVKSCEKCHSHGDTELIHFELCKPHTIFL